MIRLGLRLAVAGGREAVARLVVIAAAVALGVGLLLTTLAVVNGFFAQNQRYAWLNSTATDRGAGAQPVWWRVGYDLFDGRDIARVDVAATGPDSPVPPGLPRLPGPGEYYASPALAALLRATPSNELGDRYPGRLVGTIDATALPSPDTYTVIVGHRPEELSREPDAAPVTHIQGTSPSDCADCAIGVGAAGIDLVVSVVAGGLLFPVLIFIGTATRLSAARREERFAAMRLVGGTPRQISVLATVESAVAAVMGTVAGFALFYLSRGELATIPFTGEPFFPRDLTLGVAEVLAVALGVPVAAALAARLALRRVHISPLGVSRHVTPRAPRWYRLIPLVAGLAELAWFVGPRRPSTSGGQTAAFLPGFVLIMVGLVTAGPWLTMVGSRFLAGRAHRPAALIAARRLADDPRAGFRAVSGLVLALFVTSVAVGVITTIEAERGTADVPANSRGTLTEAFHGDRDHPGIVAPIPAGLPSVPGVRSVTVVRANPAWRPGSLQFPGLVSCADLARIPEYGHCPAGAVVAAVSDDLRRGRRGLRTADVWPAAAIGADRLAELPMLSVMVRTDGSTAAVERTRTLLEVAYPRRYVPAMDNEFDNTFTNLLAGWRQLAHALIAASLVIAGSSLAVVVAGGLSERKRPFSLLRLTGVPLGTLRRVVALESAVPLLVAAVVAAGAGFLAAQLFLRAQMQYTLRPPGPAYYLIVAVGLLASLGIIASTLPMLRRITGPETARNG